MPPMLMRHDEDPAEKILKTVGDLSTLELFGNQVLLGVYERPKVTKSGIHLADVTVQEDQHQGKAALVLKLGPSAFQSDDNYDFKGQKVAVGDWVAIFVSDGRRVTINKQLCRLVEDQWIRMKIPSPDMVW